MTVFKGNRPEVVGLCFSSLITVQAARLLFRVVYRSAGRIAVATGPLYGYLLDCRLFEGVLDGVVGNHLFLEDVSACLG